MRNAVSCVRVRVKSPLRSVELSNQPLPDRMRVEMVMPGRFIGVPELRAMEGEQFFAAIGDAYEELAQLEPERIRAIDASQPAERVLRDALAAVSDLL